MFPRFDASETTEKSSEELNAAKTSSEEGPLHRKLILTMKALRSKALMQRKASVFHLILLTLLQDLAQSTNFSLISILLQLQVYIFMKKSAHSSFLKFLASF